MFYKLTALSIQELGKRSNQEDSLYPPFSRKPLDGSLYILCDGMGGHAAGEVASGTVCETMSRYIAEHPRDDGFFDESDFDAALNAAFDALDEKDTDDEKKMGTTLTFVKFHAGGCFMAYIGDSRIYHIRPSEHRILHVTQDHSLVNDLVKLGELTPEEARTSRQKNIITRAVQPHQERRARADCKNVTDLRVGDYFFLCSDGMLEQAGDDEILNILSLKRPDADKIEILRGATKDNNDNHSAYLIRVVDASDDNLGKKWMWTIIPVVMMAVVVSIPESRQFIKECFSSKRVETPDSKQIQETAPAPSDGKDTDSLTIKKDTVHTETVADVCFVHKTPHFM